MLCQPARFKVCAVAASHHPIPPPLPVLKRLAARDYSGAQLLGIDMAIVLLVCGVLDFLVPRSDPRLTGHVFAMANWAVIDIGSAVFLLRRRLPRFALAVMVPLALAGLVLRIPAVAFLYMVFCLYRVLSRAEQRTGVALGVSLTALVLAATIVGGGAPNNPVETVSIATVAIVLVGWLAGENTRGNRVYTRYRDEREALAAAAAEAERAERTRAAIADERVLIARELHDIVAHTMSVVAVRSGVARMVLDSRPEEAHEALSIIETTARQSLAEMRMMVSMLRHSGEGANPPDLGPLPGLGDLDRLVTQLAAAGVEVEVSVDGPARPLATVADLTAYRIVQEALTNVVRHAGPTTARVSLAFAADTLDIRVDNDGSAAAASATAPLSGGSTGHGLLGMRERAALLGGTLEAGPSHGGFRVHTTLKIDA